MRIVRTLTASAVLCAGFAAPLAAQPGSAFGTAQLQISGARLTIYVDALTNDAEQTINVGEAARVRTCYGTAGACGAAVPGSVAGLTVAGDLSGPELPQAVPYETAPGGTFFLPGFQREGDYLLSNIRLVETATGRVLASAEPSLATLHVRQILLASATVTRLTLADLQARGVTITQQDFNAFRRVGDFTSADGTRTNLTYDEAGNLTDHSVGGVTRHFSYDGWGNVTTILGPATGAGSTIGYDALGRVLEKGVAGAGRVDKTFFTYDKLGRLATRTRPQSATETFSYDLDGMLNQWTTRFSAGGKPQLRIAFDYDPANRLVRRRLINGSDYRDNPQPGFRVTDDADVTDFADGLSRLSRAALVTGSTAVLGSGAVDPATAVTFTGYDLRGLPAGEAVGSVGAGLARQYDVWGNSTRVDLPPLVSAVRSYNRTFDGLDRLTRVDAIDAGGPISGFGMTWDWAGVGRLKRASSLGPVSLTHGFTYPGSSPVRLHSLAFGTASNPTAFGSFSYDWEFDSDFKKARTATLGARFVSGLGWTWTRDEGRRLAAASSTPGDWNYLYGPADEFTQIVDSNTGTSDLPTSGPEGRLEKKGTTTYTYDTEGRRIEDARFLYTWDFRSRLVRAESRLPGAQGEVVDYVYDAIGRLLTRTQRGALPDGTTDEARRPFKAQRGYLWDGDTLLAETSYNFDGGIVSRKDYVPGPGPDQTYQIKTDGRTFSLFKDEQGNPIGLLEETVSGKANLLARFLYTPYGDLHLEVGPEMRKAEFKTGEATLGPVTQTVDELSVTGWLELTTTIALAPTSYDALKVETFDAGTSTWTDVRRGELTVGVDTNPELLILFRTSGWKKSTRYRFRVTTGLKDDFGRSLQLPDDVAIELQIPLDVTDAAPIYIRTFKLGYDTAKAAANELGGAFMGGISLGFTGAVADPFSGLLYLRNRWYDPASGTWLSQDPLGDKDSPNLYGFVGARPHEKTDPLGLAVGDAWDPRTYWEGGFLGSFGHDLWNAASLGTLNRVEKQKSLGTWAGVRESLHTGTERVVNTATLGLHDNLVEQVEAEGTLGLGTAGRAASKTAYDLTPMEEIRMLAQEGDRMTGGEKAAAVSLGISKSAGLGAMAFGGAKAFSAYQEAGSLQGVLAIRRAQFQRGGIRQVGNAGEAALNEVTPSTATPQVRASFRIDGKGRVFDARQPSPLGDIVFESKNGPINRVPPQAEWDAGGLARGSMLESHWYLWRGGSSRAIGAMRSLGLEIHDFGPLRSSWQVLDPKYAVLPGMQREAQGP